MGVRLLSPTSGYPAWGSGIRRRIPQSIYPSRPTGLMCRNSTELAKTESLPLRAYTRFHMPWDPGKSHKSLGQTYLWILEGLLGRQWMAVEQEHWWQRSKGLLIDMSQAGGLRLASETWPRPTASRLQSWDASGQTSNRVGPQPYPSAVVQSPTLCNPMDCSQASLSFTLFSLSLLKFMSTESVMLSNYLTLRHSLLLLSSVFPSIRVFFSESVFHIRWPKYWSFSISPSMNIQD